MKHPGLLESDHDITKSVVSEVDLHDTEQKEMGKKELRGVRKKQSRWKEN